MCNNFWPTDVLKKINSWNALETSYSLLMPCFKYNINFLFLIQMRSKLQKFKLGSEQPRCEVYVIFVKVSFKG